MAGETVRTEALCLAITPWSKTSHVVTWLTPSGEVTTVVKGALRPKSFFLGQYDLNYTCEILYYARGKGDVHALRDCAPLERRDALRENYRLLALAGYFRWLVSQLAPVGPDCEAFYALLTKSLDGLVVADLSRVLVFELAVLELMGLTPEIGREGDELLIRGERKMPLSEEVACCLRDPLHEKKDKTLLDAVRVIGVFYTIHVGLAADVRRSVLRMILDNKGENRT